VKQKTGEKRKIYDTTNLATAAWYANKSKYDFSTNLPTDNTFLRMIWRGTKNVGFGVTDQYVVAWYCDFTHIDTVVIPTAGGETAGAYEARKNGLNVLKVCRGADG